MYGVRYKGTIQTEQLTVGMCVQFINKWKDGDDPGWPDSPHWAIIDRNTGYEVQPQPVVPLVRTIHDEKYALAELIKNLQERAEAGGDNTMLYVTISQLEAAKRDLNRFINRQPLGVK